MWIEDHYVDSKPTRVYPRSSGKIDEVVSFGVGIGPARRIIASRFLAAFMNHLDEQYADDDAIERDIMNLESLVDQIEFDLEG